VPRGARSVASGGDTLQLARECFLMLTLRRIFTDLPATALVIARFSQFDFRLVRLKKFAHSVLRSLLHVGTPVVVVAALAAQSLPATHPNTARYPNIVLIISDDQGWTDYGFMGHPHLQTPHLDQLARESLTFTRGYVPHSLCRPSLATIVTGLYPHQHGIVGNDPPPPGGFPEQGERFDRRDSHYMSRRLEYLHHIDRVPTIAEMLHDARGYLSHQSGKWWEGHYRRGGFTHGMTHGDRTRGGRHGDEGLTIGRDGLQPVFDFIKLAEQEDRPFLVYYAPFLPPTPHNPPQFLIDKYRDKTPHLLIATYWAMCEWFDETIGQLVAYLDEHGLSENTIVLYVTDNGWINSPQASWHAPRSKRSPYEGGVRTPIMIRWKGQVEPRIEVNQLASSIDLVPTILAAAGLEPTEQMEGINLLDRSAVAERGEVFGDVFNHDIQHMTEPEPSLQFRWVNDGEWKLIIPAPSQEPGSQVELFRIRQDEHEKTNLTSHHPAVVERLSSKLNAWWDPQGSSSVGSAAPQTIENPTSPNIVFFLSDDQRNDFLGCAGHPVVQTPFIDDLARRGVRFDHAFVTTSICAASRATLLTGLWERAHRYTFGTPAIATEFVARSYPAVLRNAGYRTGFIGKFGVKVPSQGTQQMFDVCEPLNRTPYVKTMPDGSKRHLTDLIGDRAIAFLRDCDANQPFCLSISFKAAHAEDSDKIDHYPWPVSEADYYAKATIPHPRVPTDFWQQLPEFFHHGMHRQRWFWRWGTPAKYQRNAKAYFRMITGLDRNIGRVVRELARRGLQHNTVVIFSADNGYYKGSRGFAGKWSHFDESLRVPLIVYDPRLPLSKRGRVDTHIVLNVDLPATMVGLATSSVPATYQGRDLSPLVRGESPGDWRTDFFCEHLMEHPDIPKYEGVRGSHYAYARYFEHLPEGEFLHDLESDPRQLKNLATDPEYAEAVIQMRQRWSELREELQRR